ncbi:hypothetical protein BGZ76_008441 [Entomortierella beljakovae]|nr:hypothetical protein BGZ76_008441 [Entomortierella beljakovae]
MTVEVTSPENHEGQTEQTPQTSLRFLLLGDVGVGKSSFMETFISSLTGVESTETFEESPPWTTTTQASSASLSPSIQLSSTHIQTRTILRESENASSEPIYDPLGLLPPPVKIPARDVTFVTLPGYSCTINPSNVFSMTDNYLDYHLKEATSIYSSSISTSQLAWFLIAGSKAHSVPTCAFYFVLYELKPIDILYMKLIHERVNLVPIITKSDTLSENDLWVLKKRMIRMLKLNDIKFHTFGMSLTKVESMTEQRQWGAVPFVVSSRYNPDGSIYESELQSLVKICLYEQFRYSQEDAARKIIAWRSTYTAKKKIWSGNRGSIAPPLATNTRPTDSTMMQFPLMELQEVFEQNVHPESDSTPSPNPPLQYQVADQTNPLQTPLVVENGDRFAGHIGHQTSPNQMETRTEAPAADIPTPTVTTYTPITSYVASNQSSQEFTAAQARLDLIHQSTGMVVDSSTRPSEIMDGNTINTVHAHLQEDQPVNEPDMQGVKVEIPHSHRTIYHTPTHETELVSPPTTKQRQHASLILPGGFQVPNTFVVPSDITEIIPSIIGGEVLPDIWGAVASGDTETVQRHLNNGASADQRDPHRSTLLHNAAFIGKAPYAVMNLLISYGANVNLANGHGNTVLQNVLLKHDDPTLVKLLLENGAESSVPNRELMYPLETAALFNQVESAKYLLENDLASSENDIVAKAYLRARSPDQKQMRSILKSWQGKDGEKKRRELVRRKGLQSSYPSQSQLNLNQAGDSTSNHSGGNSSKASSIYHEGTEPSSSVVAQSSTISSQTKTTNRFFKSAIFSRK